MSEAKKSDSTVQLGPVEELAHRTAWRYAHSSDPHHSHTYTFNRACLLDFARKLLSAEVARLEARDALWRQAVGLGHLYAGACPDDEQPAARDEHCPLCVMLGPNCPHQRETTALTKPVSATE